MSAFSGISPFVILYTNTFLEKSINTRKYTAASSLFFGKRSIASFCPPSKKLLASLYAARTVSVGNSPFSASEYAPVYCLIISSSSPFPKAVLFSVSSGKTGNVLDTTVGRSAFLFVLVSTKYTPFGGSSSILSMAFWDWALNLSAPSRTNTFLSPTFGARYASLTISLTSSTLVLPRPQIFISGCVLFFAIIHDAHFPHGLIFSFSSVQSISDASVYAYSFILASDLPKMRNACAFFSSFAIKYYTCMNCSTLITNTVAPPVWTFIAPPTSRDG